MFRLPLFLFCTLSLTVPSKGTLAEEHTDPVFPLAHQAWMPEPSPYKKCIHEPSSPRPKFSEGDQRRTRRIIRLAAAELGIGSSVEGLLEVAAARETSYQAGLRHLLPQDRDAALGAFERLAPLYRAAGNPWTGMPERWGTLGLFGQISALYLQRWDLQADPEVLCDPVVDIVIYVSVLRRALRSNHPCQRGTLTDLHRLASQGKMCPVGDRDQKFERRARRHGLDPRAKIKESDLGRIPHTLKEKEALVRRVWQRVEAEA